MARSSSASRNGDRLLRQDIGSLAPCVAQRIFAATRNMPTCQHREPIRQNPLRTDRRWCQSAESRTRRPSILPPSRSAQNSERFWV